MPTNRIRTSRKLRTLDDYKVCEALTLRSPLIPTEGFWDRHGPGLRCAEQRDEQAIGAAWRAGERFMLGLWVSGWQPTVEFVVFDEPGRPGTRPPGWWKYCAPEQPGNRESEKSYLTRLNLWLDGEQAAEAATCSKKSVLRKPRRAVNRH